VTNDCGQAVNHSTGQNIGLLVLGDYVYAPMRRLRIRGIVIWMSAKPSDIPQMSIARPWDSAHWFRPPQMQIPFGRKAIPVLVNYFGGPMIIALISIRSKKGELAHVAFMYVAFNLIAFLWPECES